MRRLPPSLLRAFRLSIALVWLHEGLWMKILRQDPHELSIVAAVGAPPPLTPHLFLLLIGAGETLLAIAVLTGLFARPLALFQIIILLTMNLIGILFGHGTIADPIGLLIHNLPLLLCIYAVGADQRAEQTVAPAAIGGGSAP